MKNPVTLECDQLFGSLGWEEAVRLTEDYFEEPCAIAGPSAHGWFQRHQHSDWRRSAARALCAVSEYLGRVADRASHRGVDLYDYLREEHEDEGGFVLGWAASGWAPGTRWPTVTFDMDAEGAWPSGSAATRPPERPGITAPVRPRPTVAQSRGPGESGHPV